jgi:hypothetical protein
MGPIVACVPTGLSYSALRGERGNFNFTNPVLENFQSVQKESKMHYLKLSTYKVDDAKGCFGNLKKIKLTVSRDLC